MPPHNGHVALIEFAAEQCDELIVSMSYKPDDPIPGELRLSWLKEMFQNRDAIIIEKVEDNFDDEHLELSERTKGWANFISNRYAAINIVFSSEKYGESFAKNLKAEHVLFDEARTKFPVSASLIRKNPFKYWDFLPDSVKPYFVKKICFFRT
jgi:HTH-type transcriptional repressor of NAD biosynthesis genes